MKNFESSKMILRFEKTAVTKRSARQRRCRVTASLAVVPGSISGRVEFLISSETGIRSGETKPKSLVSVPNYY